MYVIVNAENVTTLSSAVLEKMHGQSDPPKITKLAESRTRSDVIKTNHIL